MAESEIGKKAEAKIQAWLNRPDDGYSFDRIPDQMSGFYGSKNICDFTCYKYPQMYYIESKATSHDRFDFSMITDTQYDGLRKKSRIAYVKAGIILLFVAQQRAFWIPIKEIERLKAQGQQSLNITKIQNWNIQFTEIETIPNNRKKFLDYTGEIDTFV